MMLASDLAIPIPRIDFERMFAFAQRAYRLEQQQSYADGLAEKLPATASIKQGESPGILMGYDFHLTDNGPQLIEINNNAGGLYIGGETSWLPQPDIALLPGNIESRLLGMFPASWKTVAIVDENITGQFMYPEMQAYAKLLEGDGRRVFLASPEDIRLESGGLYIEGERLDAIYNRHTDFYLESEAMQHIRSAYMTGLVQLNPYPRSYALLGDKTRMADWWREGVLESCLDDSDINLIRATVPETHLMDEYDSDQAWQERKTWVFKPSARHGGKGVLLGKSITRKRFNALDRSAMVMQKFVPASLVHVNEKSFKFDVRLFTQGERLIAVAGRVWHGQITNFREEGSGWIALEIAG